MGVVYEAHDERLGRRVALKLLPSSGLLDPSREQRFAREAKAAARLHHTNIVPVFEFGHEDARLYYVMQFIEGQSLSGVLDALKRNRRSASHGWADQSGGSNHSTTTASQGTVAADDLAQSLWTGRFAEDRFESPERDKVDGRSGQRPLPEPQHTTAPMARMRRDGAFLADTSELATSSGANRGFYRGVARIGLQVAEAMAYAHGQGVLHRDIKPSNLLLDRAGNVWVVDFGLAKTADSDDLTHTGDLLGTVRYMAPERFEGICDARSDIYSLGLTLYELAALRPAYDAPDRYALIERVRREEAPRLRSLAPNVPRDLETIIHKAVAHEPPRRYASAVALADDLLRYLEDRPIQARRAGPAERTIRWCRRNPWVTAFLVASTLGAIASTWAAFRASRAERTARLAEASAGKERERAESERNRAEKSRDRAISAVRVLLGSKDPAARTEEMQPFQQALLKAGLHESEDLVRELEGDPRAESQLVDALDALITLYFHAGDHTSALLYARRSVTLAERLLAHDGSSVRYQTSLADALHHLAPVAPDEESQIAAARRSIELYQTLCREHPEGDRLGWLQNIARNQHNIGDISAHHGRTALAIESLQAARITCQQLFELGDHSPETRYLAARVELYLCRALPSEGFADERVAAGKRAIEIFGRQFQDNPQSFEDGWQLYLAQEEVGHVSAGYERSSQAVESHQAARKTLQTMAAKHAGVASLMARIQYGIAEADFNLREAYDSDPVRYAPLRRELTREQYEICEKLAVLELPWWNLKIIHAKACFDMADYQEEESGEADLGLVLKSERLWAAILKSSPSNDLSRCLLVMVRRKLTDLLAAQGRTDEAIEWRRQSLTTVRGRPELCYEVAKEYSSRIGPIGVLPTKLSPKQLEALRRRLANDAITMLREAVSAGFKDARTLSAEPAFLPIRGRTEFGAILVGLTFLSSPFAPP
jgi:tetratricopeptide (TPR) repeat protein